MSILEVTARKIPEPIRNIIKEKDLISKAIQSGMVAARQSPMEYLFDVHAEFLDPSFEFQNFDCGKCRYHVLELFKKIKDYL